MRVEADAFLGVLVQLNFAKCHLEWSRRSLEEWGKARAEIGKIEEEALQRGQLAQ